MGIKAKEIKRRYELLKSERSNWETWWQDLTKYCIPRKARITEQKASGQKHDTDVYDSTARDSVKVFAAGLMGYLTNPQSVWFKLRTDDEEDMDAEGVRTFLSKAEKKINDVFHGSNFYQQLHQLYEAIAVIGTVCFYSEKDAKTKIRYYCRPIREIFFEEDAQERVDTVIRAFELTVKQAYDKWGDKAGKTVAKLYKANKYGDKLLFLHGVGPRESFDASKRDKKNKPIYSVWVSVEDVLKIEEGGYDEMPFNVARADKESCEKHGYSFAMDVEPAIRMANKERYIIIRAAMKATDPPYLLPHPNFVLPFNMNAGAANYKLQATGAGSDEKVEVFKHEGQVHIGREDLQATQEEIKRGFFTDLFLMLADRKNMTAEEVMRRIEEKMFILGPTLGRLQSELLSLTIERTFNMLLREGEFGELPETFQNNPNFKIVYVSVLANAQRSAEVRAIQNFVLNVREIAQISPNAIDIPNADAIVKKIAEITGVDPELLNEDAVIKLKREQRAELEKITRQIQLAGAGAQVAKTGAEAAQTGAEAQTAGAGKE